MASKKNKSTKQNPTSSTILQVLLDLKNNGYGDMTIEEMATYLQEEKDVLQNLDKQWANRLYSEKSITWASISIIPALMNLSPEAIKLLVFLGIYADQTALIRVTRNVMTQVTGIKTTTLKATLRELEECGAISVEVKQVRHTAPISRRNGNVIAVGRRNKVFNFNGDKDKYILKQQLHTKGLEIVANRHTDKNPDGTKIMYHELLLVPINENEPLNTKKASKDSSSNHRKNNTSKSKNNGQDGDYNIPGQISFENIDLDLIDPEELPF